MNQISIIMGPIKKQLWNAYSEFWENYQGSFGDFFDKNDIFAPKIEIGDFNDKVPCGLLFVSCNPSGADTEYYKQNNQDFQEIIWYTEESDPSGFLDALKDFATKCDYKDSYSKLDVFCIVKKKQDDLKKHYKKNKNLYQEMFKIFVNTVEQLKPKVIVVANAFVRELFLNDFKEVTNCKEQEPNYGGYKAQFGNHETYIFFTSMLSGNHPLDVGSRELLQWAIKRYKNSLTNKIKHIYVVWQKQMQIRINHFKSILKSLILF